MCVVNLMWVQGTKTQVFTLVWKMLYPLTHLQSSAFPYAPLIFSNKDGFFFFCKLKEMFPMRKKSSKTVL